MQWETSSISIVVSLKLFCTGSPEKYGNPYIERFFFFSRYNTTHNFVLYLRSDFPRFADITIINLLKLTTVVWWLSSLISVQELVSAGELPRGQFSDRNRQQLEGVHIQRHKTMIHSSVFPFLNHWRSNVHTYWVQPHPSTKVYVFFRCVSSMSYQMVFDLDFR